MAGGPYTSLKGFNSFNDPDFSDQLLQNLIDFFDWSFLCRDAFSSVSHAYGNRGILTQSSDNPLIWESSKANWVWESSVASLPYASSQPTSISGIYIDNIFSANTGSIYKINYKYGQIVFNDQSFIPQSSVTLDYSYKRYNFYNADTPWFRQVIFDPLAESALVEILRLNRVYLPAIILEYVPNQYLEPYQLGSGVSYYYYQDVIFHILADRQDDRNKAVYALIKQFDKTIQLYDVNAIGAADDFPLDPEGFLNGSAKTYPSIVDTYPYTSALFKSVRSTEITSELPLFRASVRATIRMNLF